MQRLAAGKSKAHRLAALDRTRDEFLSSNVEPDKAEAAAAMGGALRHSARPLTFGGVCDGERERACQKIHGAVRG